MAAARALITQPEILLADEPTGALDSRNSKILLDKMAIINREQKKTIMMVTHDANAAMYCTRILFIQDGRLFHELRRNPRKEDRESFYEEDRRQSWPKRRGGKRKCSFKADSAKRRKEPEE